MSQESVLAENETVGVGAAFGREGEGKDVVSPGRAIRVVDRYRRFRVRQV